MVLYKAMEQYFQEGLMADEKSRSEAFARVAVSMMSAYGPVMLLSSVANADLAIRAT